MIKDFLEINSIKEARVYAEHIIHFVDSNADDVIKITAPVGPGISAQSVSSEVMDVLIGSHLNHAFGIRTFYGPDGPTVTSKEVLITLTRK